MPTSPRGEWYPFGTTLRRIRNVGKGRCGHRPLRKRLKLMTLPPGGRGTAKRWMRNGDTFPFLTQSSQRVQPFPMYLFSKCIQIWNISPFLIRPSLRTGAPSPRGNVINLRCFRRGRYPHRPFQTLRIRRSMVPKGYHSPRGDVGIAPYGAVVDA